MYSNTKVFKNSPVDIGHPFYLGQAMLKTVMQDLPTRIEVG
jgi:hypothetical protein